MTNSLDTCHSIADLRALAQRRLPRALFDYLDGGAEDEISARGNVRAIEAAALVPRCLVDVSTAATGRRLLGVELAWPLLCSPTGATRFYHRDGELAAARAAASAGIYYGLSTMATHSIEDVARAASGPKFFQLYVFRDRGITHALVDRCREAGFTALCLTVDAAVRGKRERELRTGLGMPIRLSRIGFSSFARHPFWMFGQALRGPLTMPSIAAYAGSGNIMAQTRYIASQLDPSIGWDDLGDLAARWRGPLAVKGILAPDDARRAVEVGASAIIVSNHGGRQLDGVISPFDALPAIVDAVGGRAEIILDGGIRRGAHIFKALALGANGCAIGRPYLFGMGAAGEAGMAHALEILRSEFVRTMQLCGCTSLADIDRRYLGHAR